MKTLRQHVLTEYNGNSSEMARAVGVTPQHIKQSIDKGAVIDSTSQIFVPMMVEHRIFEGKVYKAVKSKS